MVASVPVAPLSNSISADVVSPVGLAQKWGGADVIAGAGHFMEWDAPEEVGGKLIEFLAAQD